MRLLSDSRLYSDYDYFRQRFRIPEGDVVHGLLRFHCFWEGQTTRHHLLSLKSLLSSQSHPFEVWIWTPANCLAQSDWLRTSLDGASLCEFREYDADAEMDGTPYAECAEVLRGAPAGRPTDKSNGFRKLVLAKYGGVYFDLDVLFLKDLRPLCNVEFFYQWSNRPWANSAVMHAYAGSSTLLALMERGRRIGTLRPARLLKFAELDSATDDVLVYPSFAFDPLWIAHDENQVIFEHCNQFDDFFAKTDRVELSNFFPGAYAYHWHNQWNRSIKPTSIAGQFYEEVSRRFADMDSH